MTLVILLRKEGGVWANATKIVIFCKKWNHVKYISKEM